MFFFALTYILDYSLNDKFEILASTVYTYRKYDEKVHRNNYDSHLYHTENFVILLNFTAVNQSQLDEIVNNTFLYYRRHYDIKGKLCPKSICRYSRKNEYSLIFNLTLPIAEDPNLYIDFNCTDSICSNYQENSIHHLSIRTRDFELRHKETNPIITHDSIIENSYSQYYIGGKLYDTKTFDIELKMCSIIYQEKKGITRILDRVFNITNNYSISFIDKSGESKTNYMIHEKSIKPDSNIIYDVRTASILRFISRIRIRPLDQYQSYIRSRISFLDVIAKIGALFSTFYSIFSVFVKFYSKNFDNYKIVERLLQNNILNKNKITLDKNKNNTKFELVEINRNNSENFNTFSPLIINNDNDSENEKEDNENENWINYNLNTIEKGNINNKILPKLSFFDFYFNNIYFKCCKRIKKQDMLNACNKIISNYVSIDYIIDSAITFENLIKDYKWNEPGINNKENNELFYELNKYL